MFPLPSLRLLARGCRRVAPACLLFLLLAACRPTGESAGAAAEPASGVSVPAGAGRPVRGEVVEVAPGKETVLVHHEEIPGYMPAMVMEFEVSPVERLALREGQRIRARMIELPEGRFRLEGIWPEELADQPNLALGARDLRQDTITRGREAYRELGEAAPAFVLVNQDGAVVTPASLRGHPVVLSFIFTRCQVATMCPATTFKMSQLQRAAAEAGLGSARFLLISMDPDYDTPAVLRDYAVNRGLRLDTLSLLTGPRQAVADLLLQFGILVAPDENVLKHTLATFLVDANGRIAHRVDGSAWSPDEFLERLRQASGAASGADAPPRP